jgi:hypothetical protein
LISRDPFLAGFAALRKQFRRNLAHPALSGEAALAPGTMARLDRHMKPANRTRTSGLPRLGKGASGKYLFKGHGGDRLAMPRLDPNATKRDVTGQHYRPGLTTANQIDSHATTLADIEPFNEHDRWHSRLSPPPLLCSALCPIPPCPQPTRCLDISWLSVHNDQAGVKMPRAELTIAFPPRVIRHFRSSSRSRRTASQCGFFDLSRTLDGPDRYGESSRFETMPSRPSRQACSNTAGSRHRRAPASLRDVTFDRSICDSANRRLATRSGRTRSASPHDRDGGSAARRNRSARRIRKPRLPHRSKTIAP